jgi:phosphoribosyl 1,2-cyclic phosphodiesterase
MQVYIWGSRGSLPASLTGKMVKAKIAKAIRASLSRQLKSEEAIEAFVQQELPFSVRESYGGNTSCIEIMGQDEYMLCDAGSGLRDFGNHFMKSIRRQPASSSSVFHLFISHLHWDHIQGFPFFIPAYIPGHRIHIYGYHLGLEMAFVNQQNPSYFPVALKDMKADISFHVLELGKDYDIGGFAVKGMKQNHPGDSYGYCFMKEGRKIVYSTDAEHKEDADDEKYVFLDFCRDADLLIFDAQYIMLDAIHTKENWGHSSNLIGVELALKAGVKRLCLFHNEHTSDDEALDQFLDDTRKYLEIQPKSYPLKIDLAYDGLEIEI